MLEQLVLELANLEERYLEKKKADEGTLFVPYNFKLREISEALFLDGALPGDINRIILDMYPSTIQNNKNEIERKLADIRDSLGLDGADSSTIRQVVKEAKQAIIKNGATQILRTYEPFKKVDLNAYWEG